MQVAFVKHIYEVVAKPPILHEKTQHSRAGGCRLGYTAFSLHIILTISILAWVFLRDNRKTVIMLGNNGANIGAGGR